jgi:predicted DNA-binding transcriptional regulator YafY
MKQEKILPRPLLARIYFIDRKIASGVYPNTKDLAEEYEVGTATICRDIEFMRDRLDAPIKYSPLHRGFFYTEKAFRLPARFAAAEDMLALGMVKTLLSLYRNTPLYEAACRLMDSITAPLAGEENGSEAEPWYEKRILTPLGASYPVDEKIWNPILTGLRENRIVTFEYQSVWNENFKLRRTRPYQLLFDAGVWYLYAYAEERGAIRMFSLSRIRNISVTNDTFSLPQNYDYREWADGSYFGVFAGQEKERFRVAFYGDYVLWAKERIWAADQKIEDTAEGVIIDFSSTQYGKVLEWVLSKGAWAVPLEPVRLVRDWEWNIEQMKKNLKKTGKIFDTSVDDEINKLMED